MKAFSRQALAFVAVFSVFLFPICGQTQEANKDKFSMGNCKKIFSIHNQKDDGFLISKCIDKGPALTDYAVFTPENCIVIDLDDSTQSTVNTPIGQLSNKKVYYIEADKKPRDITTNYRFPYKTAAGICYFVPGRTDVILQPKKSGFKLFNWESESFTYCRQMEDGILMINPKEMKTCSGSSGTVKNFANCDRGVLF